MTVSAPANRRRYNLSRSITFNTIYIFGTAAFAIAVMSRQYYFISRMFSYMHAPPTNIGPWFQQQLNLFWLLICVILFGITGTIVTLISVFLNRHDDAASSARVRKLSVIMLVVSYVLSLLALLTMVLIVPRFYELFRTYELHIPDISRFYLSFCNIATSQIGFTISCCVMALLAILSVSKEFLLKDKVTAYLLNACFALFLLVWLAVAYIAALRPFIITINAMPV